MIEATDPNLITNVEDAVGHIILSRPQALNALTLDMVRMIAGTLKRWEEDPRIKAVVFSGAGERAFCAGGDIKAAYYAGMKYRKGQADLGLVSLFFDEEYELNRQLFHYPKPLLAYMDGITMGGGFGVAGPCDIRLATARTVFAMPETAIGFFPDVGSTYFLQECPGQVGAYLAVTGDHIGAADTVWSGLATHYTPDVALDVLIKSLNETVQSVAATEKEDLLGAINRMLSCYDTIPQKHGDLYINRMAIDKCFKGNTVTEITTHLAQHGSEWSRFVTDMIEMRSPTSVHIALAHYRQAKGKSFDEVMASDCALVTHFLQGHDFYEGVRAMVIDKDRQPQWNPFTLEGVDQELIDTYLNKAEL